MRISYIILLIILLAGGLAIVKHAGVWRSRSQEVVQLDDSRRALLEKLRQEEKFEPNDFQPLGYTGMASPGEAIIARAAVNEAIDAVLSQRNGQLSGDFVVGLIRTSMRHVTFLETEDRDRCAGYMREIWYLLGFKGATGIFSYGAAFKVPEGYGEPLPPGWKAPTEPRHIGTL